MLRRRGGRGGRERKDSMEERRAFGKGSPSTNDTFTSDEYNICLCNSCKTMFIATCIELYRITYSHVLSPSSPAFLFATPQSTGITINADIYSETATLGPLHI